MEVEHALGWVVSAVQPISPNFDRLTDVHQPIESARLLNFASFATGFSGVGRLLLDRACGADLSGRAAGRARAVAAARAMVSDERCIEQSRREASARAK